MSSRFQHLLTIAAVILLALLFAACTANDKPSTVETAIANAAKDVVIPIEAEKLKNPLHPTPEIVEQGKRIYQQSCALCHGEDGHGESSLGRNMYPPAMDLTSPHVQHWDDSAMFWIIQNGVRLTGMASWKGTISADDTWKLVAFIRHLPEMASVEAKTAAQPPAQTHEQLIAYGKTLYRQEGCFICHRLDGEGTKVGPDLTEEGRRGRSVPWLIGHFKDPGAYVHGSIMPSFKNLTDDQLNALTTFLLSQTGHDQPK